MMHSGRGNRGRQRLSMINHIQNHLQHGCDDGRPARRAGNEHRLIVFQHERWRHRTEHALTGGNGIGCVPEQPVLVGLGGAGGKIVHFVVHQNTSAGNDPLIAKAAVQGRGQGNHHAVAIDHRVMGRLFAFLPNPVADCRAQAGLIRVIAFHTGLGVV